MPAPIPTDLPAPRLTDAEVADMRTGFRAAVDEAWGDDAQRERCLSSLIEDGLVDPLDDELFALPGHR